MKDASDNIKDWLYGALNTTVSYGGSVVPVYSFAPKDAAMPYILLGEQVMTGENESTKDKWLTIHEVIIEIWTSFAGNDASYIMANTISDSVMQLLRKRTATTITGYNVVSVTVSNLITDRFLIETKTIIYKSINIRLLLEEN